MPLSGDPVPGEEFVEPALWRTKIVLTAIAIGLCALMIQNSVRSAVALGQLERGDSSYRAYHISLEIKHSGSVGLNMDTDQMLVEIGGELGLAHCTAVVPTKDVD